MSLSTSSNLPLNTPRDSDTTTSLGNPVVPAAHNYQGIFYTVMIIKDKNSCFCLRLSSRTLIYLVGQFSDCEE